MISLEKAFVIRNKTGNKNKYLKAPKEEIFFDFFKEIIFTPNSMLPSLY